MASQAFKNQSKTYSLGNELFFHEPPVSLKEIAAFKIAVDLWYDVICRKTETTTSGNKYYKLLDDVDKICERRKDVEIINSAMEILSVAGLPAPVKKIIKDAVESVCGCMSSWIQYERLFVFETASNYSIFHSYLRCSSWRLSSKSKIDYKESAKNLVSKIDSLKIKGRLMGIYCFEDGIRGMSLILLEKHEGDSIIFGLFDDLDTETYSESELKKYWICVLKNDFQTLPYQDAGSVANYMITHHSVDTWSAVEYFWQKLDHNDKVEIAKTLLTTKTVAREHQKELLLLEMTEFQRFEIITAIPEIIIINFWLHSVKLDLAFEVWIRVSDKITGDQFASLINTVLTHPQGDAIQEEHNVPLLVDVWKTAPDHLKNYILSSKLDMIINVYRSIQKDYSRNLKFLSLVFSCVDVKRRVGLIFDHGFHFIKSNAPCSVYEVVKVCFDFPDGHVELQRFKKTLMKSPITKAYCSELLNAGDFKNLNALFRLYSPDEINATLEFRKNLLNTYDFDSHRSFIFQTSRWAELCDFVDETFQAQDLALNIKKRFILGCSKNCDHFSVPKNTSYADFWFENVHLNEIQNVAENFLNTQEINTFKQNLLDGFVRKITAGAREFWFNFKEENFHRFELWCLGNEQNILEFKLSLLVDDIFNVMFAVECWNFNGEPQCPSRSMVAVDTFLRWVFGTLNEVHDYKLRRIFLANEDTCLKNYFEQCIEPGYDEVKRKVIQWFFDGDEEQIERYRPKESLNYMNYHLFYPAQVYDHRSEDFDLTIMFYLDNMEWYHDGWYHYLRDEYKPVKRTLISNLDNGYDDDGIKRYLIKL